jgi:HAD superfamily hydrolase (TIGR01509 family)
MVDAVLLEFDGVLADTRVARRGALLGSLGEDGVMLSETEYLEHCASLPLRSAVRAALALRSVRADDTGVDLAVARAERRFAEFLQTGLSLTPGARELVEALQGRTRLGIVSRATRREIENGLALASLQDAFEFLITDDDFLAPKPSPAPYVAALERLTRRRPAVPHNVVALEDGPAGIHAARCAGLRCAAVGPLPVHLAVDADALLPTLVGQTLASIDALTSGARTIER